MVMVIVRLLLARAITQSTFDELRDGLGLFFVRQKNMRSTCVLGKAAAGEVRVGSKAEV
jgi:hypothetical protein